MPRVDRTNPVRSKSSESSYSLMEFVKAFPDDEACLQWLWRTRFSPDGQHAYCEKCEQERVVQALRDRAAPLLMDLHGLRAAQVRPTAGTIYRGFGHVAAPVVLRRVPAH